MFHHVYTLVLVQFELMDFVPVWFFLCILLIIWANSVNSLDLLVVVTLQHSMHKCKALISSCSPLHELSIGIWVCTPKIGTNPSNRHPKVVTEKTHAPVNQWGSLRIIIAIKDVI